MPFTSTNHSHFLSNKFLTNILECIGFSTSVCQRHVSQQRNKKKFNFLSGSNHETWKFMPNHANERNFSFLVDATASLRKYHMKSGLNMFIRIKIPPDHAEKKMCFSALNLIFRCDRIPNHNHSFHVFVRKEWRDNFINQSYGCSRCFVFFHFELSRELTHKNLYSKNQQVHLWTIVIRLFEWFTSNGIWQNDIYKIYNIQQRHKQIKIMRQKLK